MPIAIKMPALSPTMEEGTLAKWLVKEGDQVKSGDILAEIETDKATMEFEAVDEGTITKIEVPEGTDGVKVGTVIAMLAGEGEDASAPPSDPGRDAPSSAAPGGGEPVGTQQNQPQTGEAASVGRTPDQAEDHGRPPVTGPASAPTANPDERTVGAHPTVAQPSATGGGDRVKASPLARRVAAERGIELSGLSGSGPNGRIVRADVEGAQPGQAKPAAAAAPAPVEAPAPAAPSAPKPAAIPDIPHEAVKLSNVRKTIARRLTESKQTVPHIYLTVDVRLDALLGLRTQLNASLEARGVKLSVNDMLVKALAVALMQVPKCNVMFTPDQLVTFKRADISVAVSTPSGLITPVVKEADSKSLSAIATEIKELAARARDNKLKPEEYQGGTASISNMGMYGIKQFDAVINPPQGMILAVGAGEKRPWVMDDGSLGVATIMSATGSFDHRAIDGADGAEFMRAFKALVENPLGMLA
ncbi:pyruvate dehydrogenase complex dihydrolipoamide acetyltransferase [Sphingomonas lenta]|uniref:Acetyltransferase component of pyruvate dehydrogenase complex n=1 Tax=Sphingomonas lenta TaxID=1141887 RepID=A0A2A2SHK8_9SPHN|nr:pyruvate dehydrogenase complex dihydrolipoamide acetyltransferase [Sphingomonas lenta]PAX08736.1 pyruvate dehydrogenase complex dihydrolipoamide acetyltransferase [Sphingomonas lenta]